MINLLKFACPLLSAFLLWSAFPPLDHGANAWYALVPLLLLARAVKPKHAFCLAWLGGFVYWAASLLWFWRLIGNGGPFILVILAQTLFAAYLGLYWGLFALASARLWQGMPNANGGCASSRTAVDGDVHPPIQTDGDVRSPVFAVVRRNAWRVLLVCLAEPLLWVGAEYLRGHVITGFPWNNLGVMVSQNLPVLQLAEYGGVHAVSFVVLLANAGLASLATRILAAVLKHFPVGASLLNIGYFKPFPLHRSSLILSSLLPLLLVMCAMMHGANRFKREAAAMRDATPETHDFWLAGLVQPNTPSIFQITSDIIVRQRAELDALTRKLGVLEPDFILWPESALLADLPYDPPASDLARGAARDTGSHILAGCGEISALTPDHRIQTYHNAVWHFNPDGGVAGKYHKRHLVPFGEYIPGSSIFPALGKLTPAGFPCTPGKGPVLFSLDNRGKDASLLASPLICFEDLFPCLSREPVRLGARVLLNATNDAWFERSLEPEFHMRQSIFRAVENRVHLLRSTATGVTCVVDPLGRVNRLVDDTGSSVSFPGFLVSRLVVRKTFAPTFYTRHGDLFFALPASLFLLATLVMGSVFAHVARRQRRRRGT